MGSLRTVLSPSVFTAAALFAPIASSGPTIEHLIAGAAAPQGSILVAGEHGARYELRGGSVVDIGAGTEFSFDPSLRVPLGKPGAPDTLTRVVRVTHGTVDVTVPAVKHDPTAVMVRGPGKMSSVTRAGTSTFLTTGDRSTAACRSGDVLVGVGNDWKPLKEGTARTLAPDDPSALPRPLVAPPQPTFDRGLVFVRGNETGSAEATWQPVKDATRYDVRVSRQEGKEFAVLSHETTTSTRASLRALTPGAYTVVVASIDKSGLSGAPSDSKSIRVAGLEAPEGAVVTDEGAIVLAKDQRVRLLASEGLEVSYGSSRFFGAAPTSLGLSHNESVVARLRAPGTSDETVIRLEPKGLRARVHIDPQAALWPRDNVNVTVELYDASGRSVPVNAEVKPTVTVNLETMKLIWQHSGHTFRATVPPLASAGPWVVRAEVRDRSGELLGRDFLEVAKTRASAEGVANR